jgi:hypothetical protein
MHTDSRREFQAKLLGSLITFGLVDLLWRGDLFAAEGKPVIARWFRELCDMTQDLRQRKLRDVEFQAKMEDLYRRVDLPELVRLVDLDRLAASVKYPARGAASLGFDLRKVEGLPAELGFGKQIFAMTKGRSVVPHGHSNMCTGFIILRGTFEGRHYDRLQTHKDHYVIRPTIDRAFGPGDLSTISDHKDNVHWFKATTDGAFIFNVHVIGYDPAITEASGRLYLDVDGEKLSGGLIKAPKMTSAECHKKFG